MATVPSSVSDLLVTVKAREVQRGMLAEMRSDPSAAARHFLAAAHLELALANDYAQAGQDDMALRSHLSAASCFWRAGQTDQAHTQLNTLIQDYPAQVAAIQEVIGELEQEYPYSAP
jgi:hypothetical protein